MHIIHLHQLNFFAFHGVFEEERKLGNNFVLNIDVYFTNTAPIINLHQTINYVTIYEAVKQRMLIPTPLLETLAEELATIIVRLDKRITKVNINIQKINAPIENFSGIVGVSYQKECLNGNT